MEDKTKNIESTAVANALIGVCKTDLESRPEEVLLLIREAAKILNKS